MIKESDPGPLCGVPLVVPCVSSVERICWSAALPVFMLRRVVELLLQRFDACGVECGDAWGDEFAHFRKA